MIPAEFLYRANDLIQRCVVQCRAQGLNAPEKGLRLFRGNPSPPFSYQQRIENLDRPKGWHDRGVPRLQTVKHRQG